VSSLQQVGRKAEGRTSETPEAIAVLWWVSMTYDRPAEQRVRPDCSTMTSPAKLPPRQAPKRRRRIGKKLSTAIDAIVFDGADLQSAVKARKNPRGNQKAGLMPNDL
jgi:hypothetical protein